MSGTLEGTTTLPVVGTTRKAYVAVGVALAAGIAGYAWWRRRQGSDATGGDLSYYADTRTGSELPTDGYTNPAPASNSGDPGAYYQAPKTDQDWVSQVQDKMSWLEPSYLAGVLGKYLARQPTTPDEQNVVRQAWAQAGHPPSNPPLINAPTGTPASPPTMKAPTGLRATIIGSTSVSLDWTPVPGATGYRLFVNGKQNGAAVRYSSGSVHYLHAATKYTIGVCGIFPGDKNGPQASISVTTKK